MECVWFEVGYGAGKEHPGVVTEGVGRGRGVESGSSSEQLVEPFEIDSIVEVCRFLIFERRFFPLLKLFVSEQQRVARRLGCLFRGLFVLLVFRLV